MKKIIIVFLIFSMGLLLFSCAKIETEINQSAKSDENNELNDEKKTKKLPLLPKVSRAFKALKYFWNAALMIS